MRDNHVTNYHCEDVDFNEAVDVAIEDLVMKYISENNYIYQLMAAIREEGNCSLLVDTSREASRLTSPKKNKFPDGYLSFYLLLCTLNTVFQK